jgi:phosphoribosylamine-glycine ligase
VHATNASEIDRLVDRIKLMNWIGANLSAATLEQYKDWLHARLVRYWIKINKHYTQESIKKNLELINGKRSYFYYLYKYLHRKVRKLFFRPA